MRGFYIFGAGVNCYSVMDFFKDDNVLKIIDNNERIQHTFIKGVQIVSFEEYISLNKGEDVLVTPRYYTEEICKVLRDSGIYNVFKSPWMQDAYYSCPSEILQGKRFQHPVCKDCVLSDDITNEADLLDPWAEEILKRMG